MGGTTHTLRPSPYLQRYSTRTSYFPIWISTLHLFRPERIGYSHNLTLTHFSNGISPSHTPSITFPITPSSTPNSVSTLYIPPHHRQLYLFWMTVSLWHFPWPNLWLYVTFCDQLCHGLRHVLYHCIVTIVLLLSLFFYIYKLALILAEVLSYSFRTSC